MKTSSDFYEVAKAKRHHSTVGQVLYDKYLKRNKRDIEDASAYLSTVSVREFPLGGDKELHVFHLTNGAGGSIGVEVDYHISHSVYGHASFFNACLYDAAVILFIEMLLKLAEERS